MKLNFKINNKLLKQTSNSIDNTDSERQNTNIKLKISSSSKNYPNINYTFLPKLNESESHQIIKQNNEYLELEENTNTDYKEELNVITSLWDELGVTEDYKYQFNQILESNNYNSKILFFQEKENLQKFKTSLIKLKKEINNRENNIKNLLKIIRIIDEEKEANQNLLKEVVNIIKSLRLNAVNIVIYINRVRELGFYYYFQGKWDLTKIKNEYIYNNNYLLQMSEDLYFLRNCSLNKYIEIGNEKIDAFLTNCSQLYKDYMNIDNEKIIIPISDDLIKLIEQCVYFVIQDQIMDNIYQKKSLAVTKNNSMNGMNRSNSTKIKIKKVPSRPMTSKGIFNINNNNINNYKDSKKNVNNIFNGLENRLLHTFKNGNNIEYNNLFQLSTKLNEPKNNFIPESTRIKNRAFNQDGVISFDYNNGAQKKIKIEHEIISSMNSFNGKNRTYLEKNRNNSNEKIIIENEKLKKDNQVIKNELQKLSKKIEENEKFKKKLEDKLDLQKKEMIHNSNSVEEIKLQLLKEKKEIEQKLKDEIEKNIKSKKENKIINKEIQLQIDKSKYTNNIKHINIYKKHNLQKIKNKYNIEYYKDNVESLIDKLKLDKFIDKIDIKLKQIFDLENKIYNKEFYLKGQNPKILICKLNEKKIIGVCSFYFNNNSIQKGILYVNYICVIEDKENSFEQIYDIIKFIKENENYNKIIIDLNENNNENKENIIINYLKENVGFNFNIINNKSQLIYNNENKDYNDNNNNDGYLNVDIISLLSLIKKNNIRINDIINDNYKYINNLPIFLLLLNQKKFVIDFNVNIDKPGINNLIKESNSIINLLLPENNNIEELISIIEKSNIKDEIKGSLCFKNSSIINSFGLIKLNINLNFKNILQLKYKNFYYNRIASSDIEIIKDTNNSCVIYNIPSLNENINILILELNEKIKNILINNDSNIYELFLNYYKTLNNKIIGEMINILIPSFKIEKHFQTQKKTDDLKKVDIYESINKNNVFDLGLLDEYLNIKFKEEDININGQVNYFINNKDIIINNEFLLGIINNNKNKINESNELSLIQLSYISKDDWIKYN